ncbi:MULTISPECIES: hotdog family protein [unclassified Pseudomonas]|uniref:hotdog family protein n=1 Tax=unclassified Pseudomonas TaxID=196821 RepID=UPI000BD7CF87|nr:MULTISPECIES: hotdog family protein [unclassified Pseudomonas]PVZ15477.1 putative hotdog family 3-hydroxylacyl-ACP dehydratase [Pseudomonas sp. URIL14HWK12:I12]PVZ24851.1 putative hotdog family 3-hydroxylacyl-ACP dehydratase [Pseudomonas sp. URIL14HWK12:I10]PVZ34697.1 putative hotdog family 3-hydroxylacyl-ACP dehydratase [Pseudomonas sp. URIL14HWK12:I11]SNZ08996.1 Predicted 3-hydroxylacyl-ACP dehydratase, HotDog domain [Pseudomonas sp. URIL14HWK12:I9]
MIPWPLAELLPHAGDVILLDAVEHFDDDGILAHATVRPGTPFSDEDGSLPAWVGVELMAQAVAAYAGCRARAKAQPVEMGFLLGTRKYECTVERFPAGSALTLRALRSLEDESGMGVFECHLEGPGFSAQARLNVYRPPNAAQYLAHAQETSND